MDVFSLRDELVDDYKRYTTSFLAIRDDRIRERVRTSLDAGYLWPEARVSLNPAFASGGMVDDLVADGLLHPTCSPIFRMHKEVGELAAGAPMRLHRHQSDAIRAAAAGDNHVLTTGTGSGKSLAYIVPIVDHVLRHGSGGSVKAIVVYPMNALANSQRNELEKFLRAGFGPGQQPVTFARYTGQEDQDERKAILDDPPDILLTNYVMLELILTRNRDRKLVDAAVGLRFLVLDELHTYRGRQGADIAVLVRRLRDACQADELLCVGTSATLATDGTWDAQRTEIASVASLLFGAEVRPASIIGETLERATEELDAQDPALVATLRARIEGGEPPPTDHAGFVADPLSSWIESTFGIVERDGRLERVKPLQISGEHGAARMLGASTGLDEEACGAAIRHQLLAGNQIRRPEADWLRTFAFRLHQFFSRGDTVYASLEPELTRHLTLRGQRFVPQDRSRILLPLAFCRQCGQEYYTAMRRSAGDGTVLEPRDLGDHGDTASNAGFVLLVTDDPWTDDADMRNELLPEDWIDVKGRVKDAKRKALPVHITIRPDGSVLTSTADVAAGDPTGWWVPAPFQLCLRCRHAYTARGNDVFRLSKLGVDGRSTATTVLSLSAVRLLKQADLDDEAKKLLAFTDNRQDASLQAGHFNDFVQVVLLRSALYRAVADAGPDGLEHDRLTQAVYDALDLPRIAYAAEPEAEFGAGKDTDRALREVLGHLLYVDLQRGWRVTSPNLEQCGLLTIAYDSIGELCASERHWAGTHPALADASPAARERVATALLDWLRRALAVKSDFLDVGELERLQQRSNQRLRGRWTLPSDPFPTHSFVALPRSQKPGDHREWLYVSALGGVGRFLRRRSTFEHLTEPLTRDDTRQVIEELFTTLQKAQLVEPVLVDADGTPGYQVPAAAMRWVAGAGTTQPVDPVCTPAASIEALPPNAFFGQLYSSVATELIGVEAAEHTAQVPPDDRLEREALFRTAALPVLYCSPTMELGVDIAGLNAVAMRNVPPTPANYAQRSGRAGRSGQPALVFTYCSAGSPHDQWYFRHQEQMVAGSVSPPRLDLANEDLLRSHLHAVWLATVGLDLRQSLTEILDIEASGSTIVLQPDVEAHLLDTGARARALRRATNVFAGLDPILAEATWWHDQWFAEQLDAVPARFRTATERWYGLYRAAQAQFDLQSAVVKSASASGPAKDQAKRLRREAEAQLEQLQANTERGGFSDFNSYRYFASEGFLPGYSFPRLPLSAFIAGRRRHSAKYDGEYISRPRFLAVSEFGPRSLVYHEGNRYEITRVILPPAEQVDPSGEPVLTSQAKRCDRCGYFHPMADGAGADRCEFCHTLLPSPFSQLFRLSNVSTTPRYRITSDEEERRRQGFELTTSFRFAERHGVLSKRTAVVTTDGAPVAHLTFGDTAQLWRLNLGQRRRADADIIGFRLDVDSGDWVNEKQAGDEKRRVRRVVPYVQDARNCLIVHPEANPGEAVMASLESALRAAVALHFQLEENELATEPLPGRDQRDMLLLFESAEGGAGVLRRLVNEPSSLAGVARTALELCHFAPDGTDLGHLTGDEACEAACYDCLLSYDNQPDHSLLDRRLLLPYLLALAGSTVEPGAGATTAVEAVEALKHDAESELERTWVAQVTSRGYRLPTGSQRYFEQAAARVDFDYEDNDTVVFVDGPWHGHANRAERDTQAADRLRQLGLKVIRFGPHPDDWAQVFADHTELFGEGN